MPTAMARCLIVMELPSPHNRLKTGIDGRVYVPFATVQGPTMSEFSVESLSRTRMHMKESVSDAMVDQCHKMSCVLGSHVNRKRVPRALIDFDMRLTWW